jgi:hypothetical protein
MTGTDGTMKHLLTHMKVHQSIRYLHHTTIKDVHNNAHHSIPTNFG